MITRSKAPPRDGPEVWVRKGQDPPGTRIGFVSHEIGNGVFAEREFKKGEFLFEYAGTLKTSTEVARSEQTFVFHFIHRGSNLCIDASTCKRIGKYANDDWEDPEAIVKKVVIDNNPRLLLFARRSIGSSEEIRFDYGQPEASWRHQVAGPARMAGKLVNKPQEYENDSKMKIEDDIRHDEECKIGDVERPEVVNAKRVITSTTNDTNLQKRRDDNMESTNDCDSDSDEELPQRGRRLDALNRVGKTRKDDHSTSEEEGSDTGHDEECKIGDVENSEVVNAKRVTTTSTTNDTKLQKRGDDNMESKNDCDSDSDEELPQRGRRLDALNRVSKTRKDDHSTSEEEESDTGHDEECKITDVENSEVVNAKRVTTSTTNDTNLQKRRDDNVESKNDCDSDSDEELPQRGRRLDALNRVSKTRKDDHSTSEEEESDTGHDEECKITDVENSEVVNAKSFTTSTTNDTNLQKRRDGNMESTNDCDSDSDEELPRRGRRLDALNRVSKTRKDDHSTSEEEESDTGHDEECKITDVENSEVVNAKSFTTSTTNDTNLQKRHDGNMESKNDCDSDSDEELPRRVRRLDALNRVSKTRKDGHSTSEEEESDTGHDEEDKIGNHENADVVTLKGVTTSMTDNTKLQKNFDESMESVNDSDCDCGDYHKETIRKKKRTRVIVSDSDDSSTFQESLAKERRLDALNHVGDSSEPNSTSENEESDSEPDEEEVLRDKDYPAVYVKKVVTSRTTKTGKKKKCSRVYDTIHCCTFCQKLYKNFSQHILGNAHTSEAEVVQIVQTKPSKTDTAKMKLEKKRRRKQLFAILRNRGDNHHNMKVLKKKSGQIILGRRLSNDQSDEQNEFSIAEYGPCPTCFEWLKLSVIPRHQNNCPALGENAPHLTKGNLLIQSSIIAGRVSDKASNTMITEVFPVMRTDAIGLLAKSDSLIVALGNQWLVRNLGNRLMRKYYVSAVMRLSSRLLLQLRGLVTPTTGIDMTDYLDPKYFTYVAQAALRVARQDSTDEENLQAPSNALKLSHDIKRLANIKLAKAIQRQDKEDKESAKDFLQLMSIQWSTKLERVILEERKHVTNKPLPLPSDVVRFSNYLIKEANLCDLEDTSYTNFRKVAILTLASLISYNRRRPGEVQAIQLSSYFSRKTGVDDIGSEIAGELSKFERRLLLDQDVLEVRGKCGKFVPVIVPKHAKASLQYLTDSKVRKSAGISSNNHYVFASNRSGVIRGGYAMIAMTDSAGLVKPERIRATNMRRFMATMSQGLNITPQQQQWLVDHMGHTLNVHHIHYRSTLDLIERIDISKLLLMMDMGQISRFKGKRLEDIQIEELLDQPDIEATDEAGEGTVKEQRAAKSCDMEEEYIPDLPMEDDEEESLVIFEADRKKPRKTRKQTTRHKWTDDEIEEVYQLFSIYFKRNKTPGEKAIRKAMEMSKSKEGTLWQLPLKSIKSKVSWLRLKKVK